MEMMSNGNSSYKLKNICIDTVHTLPFVYFTGCIRKAS